VEYENKDQADAAIEGMDGKKLLGQQVHVDYAFVKGPCFSCGFQPAPLCLARAGFCRRDARRRPSSWWSPLT
jgi:RNA recognition motif-containing protein